LGGTPSAVQAWRMQHVRLVHRLRHSSIRFGRFQVCVVELPCFILLTRWGGRLGGTPSNRPSVAIAACCAPCAPVTSLLYRIQVFSGLLHASTLRFQASLSRLQRLWSCGAAVPSRVAASLADAVVGCCKPCMRSLLEGCFLPVVYVPFASLGVDPRLRRAFLDVPLCFMWRFSFVCS
jgi:hypothetical protein